MQTKKNINLGIVNLLILFIIIINFSISKAQDSSNEQQSFIVEINVLDKVSSKNTILKFYVGEEKKFQNLLIKVLKCENSKFDDDPEITAYIQVKDLNISNNEKVFVFNGWTFLSSPTLNPFDHPVYDLWLSSCKII
ncbi:DUF2155 domain-containing protein [Candidatus Pelagibacter sp.]|nr:DUF2155 domain-containing protein [Candidatus Pelagibacter sp.]|tara:strand:- start:4090 stop:4500 length:411 start_codon:yes stop_codon:yes gene_type:complete